VSVCVFGKFARGCFRWTRWTTCEICPELSVCGVVFLLLNASLLDLTLIYCTFPFTICDMSRRISQWSTSISSGNTWCAWPGQTQCTAEILTSKRLHLVVVCCLVGPYQMRSSRSILLIPLRNSSSCGANLESRRMDCHLRCDRSVSRIQDLVSNREGLL
jgi:hypothetical protein